MRVRLVPFAVCGVLAGLLAGAGCRPGAQRPAEAPSTTGLDPGSGGGKTAVGAEGLAPAPAPAPVQEAPPRTAIAPATQAPAATGAVEVFPHVRVDRAARVVEFDAAAAVDAHDPETPRVYLELVCCAPDTREHEALLVTRARPAHIHAALLMIGLEPGAPGLVDFRGPRVEGRAPTGAAVSLAFEWTDGDGRTRRDGPERWVVAADGGRALRALPTGEETRAQTGGVWGDAGGWVFAGSRVVRRRDPETGEFREVYDADGSGVVIGLATFGSEVVGWRQVLSPESAITVPAWVVNAATYPRMGTPVVVRVSHEGSVPK